MSDEFHLHLATLDDAPRLHELIALSVRGLMSSFYGSEELELALGNWLGLDTQLILDQTYFAVTPARDDAALVGCGGWSKRSTPYGSDHRSGREDRLLDPRTEPAKIRAFFIHPAWARRGIGSRILKASEQAAIAAGFRTAEMGATLSGVPLYARCGYREGQRLDLPLANGLVLPIVKMHKQLV